MPFQKWNLFSKTVYPKDTGYAWVVCFGSSAIMVILMGNVRCFGVFLVEIQHFFNTSSATISTLLGVEYMANCITAFVVMNCFSTICSCRTLVMIGSLLCSLCFILDSCANDVTLLPFFHLINGAGISFMFGPSIVIIGYYFEKYRGTANALASCGTSVGQFVLSPLFSFLISTYGIKGALFINSGLFLQCLVFAMLLRPIGFYDKLLDSNETKLLNDSSENKEENGRSKTKLKLTPKTSLAKEKLDISEETESVLLTYESGKNNGSEIVFDNEDTEAELCSVNCDITNPETNITLEHESFKKDKTSELKMVKNESLDKEERTNFILCRKMLANISLSLLRKKVFVILFFGTSIAMVVTSVPLVYFPAYSKDIQLGRTKGVYFVSLVGFGDLGGRVLTCILADWRYLNRTAFLGISLLLNGLVGCFVPFFTTFFTFSCYCVLFGISGGIYFAISTTVMTDFIGIKKLSQGLGMVFLFVGIMAMAIFPLFGHLRDITGSYHIVFILNAVGLIASGILFLIIPLASRHI